MWYRVFGSNDVSPDGDALLWYLHGLGLEVDGRFEGDEQGWFHAALSTEETHEPIEVERFLAAEEGIRDELNAWAAWVESTGDSPTHVALMQQLVSAQQLLTIDCPDAPNHQAALDHLCAAVSRFLAQESAGVYQVDGQGFFAADGTVLVPEE
jgi:hypothetical protein